MSDQASTFSRKEHFVHMWLMLSSAAKDTLIIPTENTEGTVSTKKNPTNETPRIKQNNTHARSSIFKSKRGTGPWSAD